MQRADGFPATAAACSSRTYDRFRCQPAAATNTAISPRGASRPPSSRNCSPPAATSSPSSPGPSSKPTRCCAWTSRRSASTVPVCRSSDSSARVEAYSSSPRSMASNDSSRPRTPAAANMVRSRWAPDCSRSPSSTPPNCRHRCTARRCATHCRSKARTPTPWSLTETRTAFHKGAARAHSRFPGAVQCVGKDGL